MRRPLFAAFGSSVLAVATVLASWLVTRGGAGAIDVRPAAAAIAPTHDFLRPPGGAEIELDAAGVPVVPIHELPDDTLRMLVRFAPETLGSLAVGRPNRGVIFNAVQMPSGSTWEVMDPNRAWGTRETIDAIIRAIDSVDARFPDTPKLAVGQISAQRGGYLRPHRSHQLGRDVDLGYYYSDGSKWYTRATESNLDAARTWALLVALLPDAEYVFMDRSVQAILRAYAEAIGEDPAFLDEVFGGGKRGAETKVRHEWGHLTHLHVRFKNPVAEAAGLRAYPFLVEQRMIAAPARSVVSKQKRRRR